MFVSRKSNHIQEDIKRNWSSWNFGQEGFIGTYNELQDLLRSATDSKSVWISGFDIYAEQVSEFNFGELYANYWVAIDNVNAKYGLSAIELKSESLENAINEANSRTDYFGDGISFDASEAKLVYSNEDIHIFEIED
jgi:hypothetical protein